MGKMLIFALALSLFPGAGVAAQQAGAPESSTHIFTTPSIRPASFNGNWELFIGGRFGWFISDRLSLGTGGYGLVTTVETAYTDSVPDAQLELGYGGLEMEYYHRPAGPVSYSLSLLLGGGEARYSADESQPNDTFFLWEPGFHLGRLVSDNMRLTAGVLYRRAFGLDLSGFDDDDFTGFTADIALRFFWF